MRVQPPSTKEGKRLWLMEAAPFTKSPKKAKPKSPEASPAKPAAGSDSKSDSEPNGGGNGISRDRKGMHFIKI